MDVSQLLEEACLKLGYCLSPDDQLRLISAPPSDVDSLTDAILGAEGLDLAIVEKKLRRHLRAVVASHFENGPRVA